VVFPVIERRLFHRPAVLASINLLVLDEFGHLFECGQRLGLTCSPFLQFVFRPARFVLLFVAKPAVACAGRSRKSIWYKPDASFLIAI
jgi:hypothetical protein